MVGRFTARRAVASDTVPALEKPASSALEGVSWTAFPEPAAEPTHTNPLLSDKLLDAKVRLHRRLIEEINLSALEKLPEEEIRRHIQQLVTQYIVVERLALNAEELNEFVSEILDEMTGLGPLEPLLKDPGISDILINGHECVYV
ncbi:MAG: pilus assembly protein CpaF, partial [Alphaproteobacteria bacterium]|nr:pilus assembly protein CpaF [Alphaproteobacteria bacterium]